MSELWWGLKNSSQVRLLFVGVVICGCVAIGIPAFLVLNYFFQWLSPS